MTYIGQQPATTFDAGIQDRFTGLSSNTVTLTHEIAAEEDILVVWNNIVQDKNTYSVGGTGNKTLTLGGTLVSADVVTVYYLNKVMQSVNPTAGSVNTTQLADLGVTGAKLNTDVISAQTALGATPADTDELLVSDAGVLKRVDYSHIKAEDNKPLWDIKEGGATSVGNNTNTTIEYDVVIYDTDSNFNTSTYKYVIPSNGYYFVRGSIAIDWSDSGANERADLSIRKNSASIIREMRVYSGDAISGASNLEASGIFLFSQNDEVYISLFKTDGGSKSTDVYQGYSQFQGFKVASS